MPISDFGSYPMTGQEIKSHWTNVDADRLAHSLTVLKLPTDYGLTDFSADLTDVQAVLTELEDLENANQIANATRDFQRTAMRDRAVDFRGGVKYRLKDSVFVGALPDTPHENASEQKLVSFLDDVASVWTRINAATNVPGFTPPLLLRNGYSLATFQTDIGNLRAAFAAVTDAEVEWRLGRQGERAGTRAACATMPAIRCWRSRNRGRRCGGECGRIAADSRPWRRGRGRSRSAAN